MNKIVGNVAKAAAYLVGIFALALFSYDMIAVRPNIPQIKTILAQANPEDAAPPEVIRDLIDANSGSPVPYATRLVTSRVYSHSSQLQRHVRELLWSVLLPMHFSKTQMYGLYSVLSYNGIDDGLSNFAHREYEKTLGQLSPIQAATTVAITHAPTYYLRSPGLLDKRAKMLLEKSRNAP